MKNGSLLLLLITCIWNLSAQEELVNSNKSKRYFYHDSLVAVEKWFGDDEKLDSLKTYFNSGSINEIFYYEKGKLNGFGYSFDKTGKKLTTWKFKKGITLKRINHTQKIDLFDEEIVQLFFNELKALNDSLKNNPRSLNALSNRSYFRLKLNNKILALDDFLEMEKKFNSLKKSDLAINDKYMSSLYGNIGYVYSLLHDKDKALNYRYKNLIFSSKDIVNNKDVVNNMVATYNFGAYLHSIKAYRLSLHYLNIVIKKWKKHGFTNRTLANLYTNLGLYKKALDCAEIAFPKEDTIIKYSSKKPVRDLRTIRGWLYYKTGATNKGILDLKESLEINKKNPYAHRHLGVIYQDIGNYELACEHLQKAKKFYYEEVSGKNDLNLFLKNSCDGKPTIETKEVSLYTKLSKEPSIYPNPITDHFTIKNFPHDVYEYEIYDMYAKLITSSSTTKNRINISDLPQGVYNLNIIKNNLFKNFIIIKK